MNGINLSENIVSILIYDVTICFGKLLLNINACLNFLYNTCLKYFSFSEVCAEIS